MEEKYEIQILGYNLTLKNGNDGIEVYDENGQLLVVAKDMELPDSKYYDDEWVWTLNEIRKLIQKIKTYPIINGDWYMDFVEKSKYYTGDDDKYVTLDNGDIWQLTKKEINELRKNNGSDFEYNRHFKTYIQYS
jgi:hypothetical protein